MSKAVSDLSFVAKLHEQTQELEQASEDLLRKIANEDIDKDDPSFLLVVRCLGWNERDVEREINRMRNVVEWEQKSESDQAFANRIEQADALKKRSQPKREKLIAAIEAAQQELAQIDQSINDAEAKITEVEVARERLRKLVPSFVRKAFDKAMGKIAYSPTNQRRLFLESELKCLEQVANGEIDPDRILGVCETRYPHLVQDGPRGKFVPFHEWEAMVETEKETLANCRAEFERLDAEVRALENELLDMLNVYIDID